MDLNELMSQARYESQTTAAQIEPEPIDVQTTTSELQVILERLSAIDPGFRRFIELEVMLLNLCQSQPLTAWQVSQLQRVIRLGLRCATTPARPGFAQIQLARVELIVAIGEMIDIVDERAEECEVASALQSLMAQFGIESDLLTVALLASRALGRWMQHPTVAERIASFWKTGGV